MKSTFEVVIQTVIEHVCTTRSSTELGTAGRPIISKVGSFLQPGDRALFAFVMFRVTIQ